MTWQRLTSHAIQHCLHLNAGLLLRTLMTRETLNFGQLLETLTLVYLVDKYPR